MKATMPPDTPVCPPMVNLTVRMPSNLYRKILAEAASNDTSVEAWITAAVEFALTSRSIDRHRTDRLNQNRESHDTFGSGFPDGFSEPE